MCGIFERRLLGLKNLDLYKKIERIQRNKEKLAKNTNKIPFNFNSYISHLILSFYGQNIIILFNSFLEIVRKSHI